MPGGRPTLCTPEMVEAICELLATGHSMASICEREGFPSFPTVWRWEVDNEEFRNASARAREIGTHYMADECIAIADDGTNDTQTTEDGTVITNHDVIQRSKLRIDTRMRLIGKWNAKAYGEKLELNANVKNATEVVLPYVPGE